MRWSQQEYEAYERKRASSGGKGLRATDQKPVEGNSLERAPQGKDTGLPSSAGISKNRERAGIRFRVFSTRPCDWDNYSVKEIQDGLLKAGLLDSDDWDQLQGSVISEKVHSKEEERTVIEITYP